MAKPCIVLRSHNDMPLIRETLVALKKQDTPFDLIALDNASQDGTREEIAQHTDKIIHVPQGSYVPGKVLNQGMQSSTGELVVFLNSDCTPQHESWLKNLLAGFAHDEEGKIAAVFGRQIPRLDCHPLYAKDTEDTYGDGRRQKYWRHCFSMASSAIRRSVWEKMRFDESLQYSEDIDWTWRARQSGYDILYVPDSMVMHSHNYTWKQYYKRHYGEGKAEAMIWDWSCWQASFLRYSLLPYARQVLSDMRYCLSTGNTRVGWHSPWLRSSQMFGRRAGFLAGIKERRKPCK